MKALFEAAVEQPAESRHAFLAAAAADDDSVRRDVESLLAADATEVGFFQRLPVGNPTLRRLQAPVPDALASPPLLGHGHRLGAYEVMASLGSGGMGEVFGAATRNCIAMSPSNAAHSVNVAPPFRFRWLAWVTVVAIIMAVVAWDVRRRTEADEHLLRTVQFPLADAQFTAVTDWEGAEASAAISPDGRFVAFLADKAGELDIWVSEVGTGEFHNLTAAIAPMQPVGPIFRKLGFVGSGAEIWFTPESGPAMAQMAIPLMGGILHPLLEPGATAPSWSPDGRQVAYFKYQDGDPLFVADRLGADARQIVAGLHNHNAVWSPDGTWIYFARGPEPSEGMNVWRVRPSGESLEQLTTSGIELNFLAPLDNRTILYVARASDRSGPWLWALDVERKETRRISAGVNHYTSISTSLDGRRVVAAVADPTVNLWRVPLLGRQAEDGDAHLEPVPASQARAPRFAGTTLFYLSSRGAGDGLWRLKDGNVLEISRGVDRVISEPAAVSPDGNRAAIVVRHEGKRQLVMVSADGQSSRTLAPSLYIQGAGGQAAADWSPDSAWIVAGARDGQGDGLFKIPTNGGAPLRLVTGEATNPVVAERQSDRLRRRVLHWSSRAPRRAA